MVSWFGKERAAQQLAELAGRDPEGALFAICRQETLEVPLFKRAGSRRRDLCKL